MYGTSVRDLFIYGTSYVRHINCELSHSNCTIMRNVYVLALSVLCACSISKIDQCAILYVVRPSPYTIHCAHSKIFRAIQTARCNVRVLHCAGAAYIAMSCHVLKSLSKTCHHHLAQARPTHDLHVTSYAVFSSCPSLSTLFLARPQAPPVFQCNTE